MRGIDGLACFGKTIETSREATPTQYGNKCEGPVLDLQLSLASATDKHEAAPVGFPNHWPGSELLGAVVQGAKALKAEMAGQKRPTI